MSNILLAIFFVVLAYLTGMKKANEEVLHDCAVTNKFMISEQVYECKPVRKPLAAETARLKDEFMKEKSAHNNAMEKPAEPAKPASDQIPK